MRETFTDKRRFCSTLMLLLLTSVLLQLLAGVAEAAPQVRLKAQLHKQRIY